MKKKLKEGEVEKEGLKELEEEFVGLYAEIVKTVEEMVSLPLLPYRFSPQLSYWGVQESSRDSKLISLMLYRMRRSSTRFLAFLTAHACRATRRGC